MRAFAKLAVPILAGIAAVAASAQGPASALSPSDTRSIVAAAVSCRDAVGAERLDEQKLTADGWSLASVQNPNGTTVPSALRIFGRESIILIATPNSPGCAVMARLSSSRDYAALLTGLEPDFGRPVRTGEQLIWMLPGDRAMQVDPSGSAERPAVRIFIAYTGGRR